jgi:hypothetical protein
MSRIHPGCGNPPDQSVVSDLILRQEPDEEDDEEEDNEEENDGTRDDDGDRDDSGYSE